MKEIERIQELLKEYNYDSDGIGVVSKAIEQYVIKTIIEELEKAKGKESLNMYHNGGMITKLEWIIYRITQLKKRLKV